MIATLLIDGILYCCSPCQSSPEGTRHEGPHVSGPRGKPNRSGVVRVEWVNVPKPKRAKAKRVKERIEAVAAKVSTWPRWKRGGSAAKAKRKGGRRG